MLLEVLVYAEAQVALAADIPRHRDSVILQMLLLFKAAAARAS